MPTLLASNNATSTVAAAILATDTTVTLAATTGERFPNPASGEYFVATRADAATGLILEVVWVTARDVDTLTIVRGQEGTTPVAWGAGDSFANLWTAGQATATNFHRTGLPINFNPCFSSLPNSALSQILLTVDVLPGQAASYPPNLAGSPNKAVTGPAASYVVTLTQNGTPVATITWAPGATIATISSAGFTTAVGDVLQWTGQSPPDTQIFGLRLNLAGTLL